MANILGPKFRIWGPWDTTPERGEDLSGIDMCHHAKFHADRCHRRRDICNRTTTNIPFLTNVWPAIKY